LKKRNDSKKLLKNKFNYTDGLTPKEINDFISQFENIDFLIEADAEKFDR